MSSETRLMRKANTNSIIIHFQSFPISAVAQVSCGPSHSLEHKILHFFLRWLSIGHRCLRGRCPFHHHIPTFRWALTIKRFCLQLFTSRTRFYSVSFDCAAVDANKCQPGSDRVPHHSPRPRPRLHQRFGAFGMDSQRIINLYSQHH